MIMPRAEARIFMAGEVRQDGNHVCASCGREYAYKQAKKTLSSAFNQTELFLFAGKYLCDGCLKLFGDKDGRSKCLFYPAPGEKKVIDRSEVLPLLAEPPRTPFVLSVPYSFKKHHWLFAGLSEYPLIFVGTDDAGVELDYQKNDVPEALRITGEMLTYGVPRAEAASGAYSVLTRSRYGAKLEEWESALAPRGIKNDGMGHGEHIHCNFYLSTRLLGVSGRRGSCWNAPPFLDRKKNIQTYGVVSVMLKKFIQWLDSEERGQS